MPLKIAKNYLGIDIGGTAVKMGIVTKEGEILIKKSFDVSFDDYQTPILETVKKSIPIFLDEAQVEYTQLCGIGVSATGQIDTKQGKVIGVGGNIIHWCDAEIKKEIEALTSVKVTVVNDANCMIIGEAWQGAAKNKSNVIGITIGTGVGGGILINSNILLGHSGIAGELGHFSFNSEGKRCTCGNIGCYEQYASMTALIVSIKEHADILGYDTSKINGRFIFDEIDHNEACKKLVDEWLKNIAKGIVSLVHIFNPEMVVLGGGVSAQESKFIEPIRSYVEEHVMLNFKKHLDIVAAQLGNDAGLIGSVYYHIQQTGGLLYRINTND